MSDSEKGRDRWGTTRQIEVIKEAVEGAIERQSPPAAAPETPPEEMKIPIKLTVGIIVFAVTQVLGLAGAYYDLRGDVRLLQEEISASVQDPAIAELRLRADQLERDIQRIESNLRESPTIMDNMRRVGELNGELRELNARIRALERQ